MYCYSQQRSRPRLVRDPNCPNTKADSDEVEKAVLQELFKMSLDENYFDKRMTSNMENSIEMIENRKKEVEKQIQNLLNVLAEGFITLEIKDKIKELEIEKRKLIRQIEQKEKKENNLKNFRDKICNLHEIWGDLPFEEKRNILVALVDKIIIKGNEIMIHYNDIV